MKPIAGIEMAVQAELTSAGKVRVTTAKLEIGAMNYKGGPLFGAAYGTRIPIILILFITSIVQLFGESPALLAERAQNFRSHAAKKASAFAVASTPLVHKSNLRWIDNKKLIDKWKKSLSVESGNLVDSNAGGIFPPLTVIFRDSFFNINAVGKYYKFGKPMHVFMFCEWTVDESGLLTTGRLLPLDPKNPFVAIALTDPTLVDFLSETEGKIRSGSRFNQ